MKTVKVALSDSGIDASMKELSSYKKWLEEKTEQFVRELGKAGIEIASTKFSQAVYDGTNDVSVSIEERDRSRVAVVAVGGAALFIEFGTGVKYPDNHPEAAKNGMVRGEYGYRLGKSEKGWRYIGDPGTNGEVIASGTHAGEVHTYGNPANMSMYLTVRELEGKFKEIAGRVYV